MVVDLLYTAGLICGFLLLGLPIVRIFLGELDRTKIFIAVLTGFGVAVIVSSWLATLGIDLIWDFPALFSISMIGLLVLRISHKKVGLSRILPLITSTKNFLLYAIPIAISGTAIAFMQNGSLSLARVSIRNGPDLIGWLSSAKYFCLQKSVAPLASRIRDQIGISDPLLAFRNPHQYPATSIYHLASYTDQINGEFLIGAHRYGAPGLQAAFCRITGEGSLYHTMVGLMALSAILTATLGAMVVKDLNLNPVWKVVAVLLCGTNINILSVSMEGGFGQLLVTPFLLFLMICLVKPEWRAKFSPTALFLLVGFSLATYLDGLFILLVFAPLYFVIQGGLTRTRWKDVSSGLITPLAGACLGFVAGWTIWDSLPRLVLERVHEGGVTGGWDQGRFPLPTDFWGLFNWLPPDGATSIPRHLTLRIVEIALSAVLLLVAIRSRQRAGKFFFLSSFIFYLGLIYVIYSGGLSNSNNYALWKMSGYLGAFVILAVAVISSQAQGSMAVRAGPAKYRGRALQLFSFVLIFALVASISWSMSWKKTAQPSFPLANSQLTSILNNYDTLLAGFSYSRATNLALLGDLHYMIPSRGFGIPANRSNPPRPLAYVLPTGACQTQECLSVTFGQKPTGTSNLADSGNVIQNGDFALWNSSKQGGSDIAKNWTWVSGAQSSIAKKSFSSGAIPDATSNSTNYARWKITGNSQNYEIFQRLKGVRTLAGQSVVLTFWARQLSGSTTFQTRILQDFGTGGSPSPLTLATGGGAFSPSKSWSQFTQSFEIPSITTQKIGTHKDSSLWVDIQITNGEKGELDFWGVRLIPAPYQRLFTSTVFNIYR